MSPLLELKGSQKQQLTMIDITINAQEITSAAELLIGEKEEYDQTPIEAIAKVFSRHLEEIIEAMLADPQSYFSQDYQLWKQIDEEALKAEIKASEAA